MTLKDWILRRVLAVISVVPALTLGYIVTYALILYVHYQTSGILSAVFVGDITAFIFGQATQDYQFKFLMHFKAFRKITPTKPASSHDTPRKYLTRRFLSFLTLFPPLSVNYATVFILVNLIHFQTIWILSGVLVGDALGFAFNSFTLDYQFKFLMRFKAFREIIPEGHKQESS